MSFEVKKCLAIFHNAYSTLFGREKKIRCNPPYSPYGAHISKSIFISYGWFLRTQSHIQPSICCVLAKERRNALLKISVI